MQPCDNVWEYKHFLSFILTDKGQHLMLVGTKQTYRMYRICTEYFIESLNPSCYYNGEMNGKSNTEYNVKIKTPRGITKI